MGVIQCNVTKNSFNTILTQYPSHSSTLFTNITNEYYYLTSHYHSIKEYSIYTSSKYKSLIYINNPEKQKNIFLPWINLLIDNFSYSTHSNFDSFIQEILFTVSKTKEKTFKDLILKGTPKSIRSLIWSCFINNNNKINEKDYNEILTEEIDNKIDDQIIKDLNRTFGDNEEYTDNDISKLYNILKVYSIQDREVGYCQGINFIAKFILQNTIFEELCAYNILCFVLSKIRGYFINNFPLLNFTLNSFDKCFKKLQPKLREHLSLLDIPLEIYVGKWMQTLFTVSVPFDITCRIWDALFSYGFEFIIPISLVLLNNMSKDLMKFKDSSDAIEYIKEVLNPKELALYNYSDGNSYISIDTVIDEAKKVYKSMSNKTIKSIKENYNSDFIPYKVRNSLNVNNRVNNCKECNINIIDVNKQYRSSFDSKILNANKDNNIDNTFFTEEEIDEIEEINSDEYEEEVNMNTIPYFNINTLIN